MNLSLSDFNLPFFVSSYCVFPADAMMRHLSACPLLVLFFLFTMTLPSLRCTMMTPKSGEAGIWLPLALNKQLLSDSHGCTAVVRGGTPTGKSPRRQELWWEDGWGGVGGRKLGLSEDQIGEGVELRGGV